MKKIYYLGTCSTCAAILQEAGILSDPDHLGFEVQDIKTEKITARQLDQMKKMAGSYEALFSRIAMKYRAWGLHEKKLTEKDYRQLILREYTFLKRPVIVSGKRIFIGHAPRTVAEAKAFLQA